MRVLFEQVRAGISRNVFFMGMVSLLNDMSSEMIYPIWPIFLTSVLGAPITVVGLIEGIAEAVASIMKVFSGWFSDYLRSRKPFVVIGYLLSTLSKFFLAWATSWPLALAGRTSDRFGKGVRTSARDALIAESTPLTVRGVAFGFHRGTDTIGAIVGPLITLSILTLISLRTIFWLAAIPGILSVVVLVCFVHEARSTRESLPITLSAWRSLGVPFYVFLAINTLFSLGAISNVFIILRTQAVGLSLPSMILLYVFFNVTYAFFSLPAGRVSDLVGPRRVMILGFFLFSLVYFFFGFITTSTWFWLLLPVYGIYMALTDGVSKAYIANLVPNYVLGTAYGVFYVTTGFASLGASLAAGFLWTYFSSSMPFFVGSFMALIAALLLLVFERTGRSGAASF